MTAIASSTPRTIGFARMSRRLRLGDHACLLRRTTSCGSQRPAATAALPGGAAITMIGYGDGRTIVAMVVAHQIAQVAARRCRRSAPEREPEHLVEIAVVQTAFPVDGNQAPAHDAVEVLRPIGIAKQLHISTKLPFENQQAAEALNAHAGKGDEPI